MSKIIKATVRLMIATIMAKVIGFFRELVLASSYGASMYSDAYLIAMNIPIVLVAIIGSAIGTTFIPLYFEVDKNEGKRESLKFTNNFLNIIIILCVIISIIGVIFINPLVNLFAFGFNEETLNLSIEFTQILMLGITFTAVSYIMIAYLQVKNEFFIPGIVSIPRNMIIIISILLSVKYSVKIMIWGTLIGICSDAIFLLPFLRKREYKYNLYINIKDNNIKKALILIAPIFIGVAVRQINVIVDKSLASTLAEGSISALNYADKLNGFIMALIISSVTSVIYPTLSKLSTEKNEDEFCKTIFKSVNSVIILVIPITVGAIVFSKPIVSLLFQRGAFDDRAVSMTAIAMSMYSIGMVSSGVRDVLSKVFYSLKDTKTPMINSIIAVIVNIVLNIVLIKYLKHAGLALATSISSIVCIILLFNSLKKKMGYFGQDKIIKTTLKSIIGSIIMGFVVYFIYSLLNSRLDYGLINNTISLFVAILTGVIVYGVSIIILKVEEASIIMETVKNRLKKKYRI